jgi:hypothetical protein
VAAHHRERLPPGATSGDQIEVEHPRDISLTRLHLQLTSACAGCSVSRRKLLLHAAAAPKPINVGLTGGIHAVSLNFLPILIGQANAPRQVAFHVDSAADLLPHGNGGRRPRRGSLRCRLRGNGLGLRPNQCEARENKCQGCRFEHDVSPFGKSSDLLYFAGLACGVLLRQKRK